MRYVLWSIIIISWMSCVKTTTYSEIPSLEFKGYSKDTMRQGDFQQDSIILILYFTDGNGDFGTLATGTSTNIFIKDLRTDKTFREYKAPFVPEEGTGNGISGTIRVKVYTTCCIYPPATAIPPCEVVATYPLNDLNLEVYISDRAGNESNKITLPTITLKCTM